MEEVRERFNQNYESMINQELLNKSVMTVYNRKIYRVDRIDFSKSPMNTFTM